MPNATVASAQHMTVYRREDEFAAWPANFGMWSWGNEILVGFAAAKHVDKTKGHTYDQQTIY